MHPYLTRLGVREEVQQFFHPFYHADASGDLVFPYGNDLEHYGFAFHRIPDSEQLWVAGSTNFRLIRQVFFCTSALEAIAYLSIRFPAFRNLDNLLFLAAGARPVAEQLNWVNSNLAGKKLCLIFGKDILGRVCDLKIAAGISRTPVAVFISGGNVHVNFRFSNYIFPGQDFSLNAFERKSGYRFHIAAQKPAAFDSYLDQLKANNFYSP